VQDLFWGAQPTHTFQGRSGELALAVEGKLLCNKVVGHFDQPLADQIMSRGNLLIAQYRELTVFCDWLHMASYETSCRRTMTDWGVKLGASLKGFHVIAGARLVKMGLSVASIVVPALQMHADTARFTAAFQEVKRGRAAP
jgi:hypothetical protein